MHRLLGLLSGITLLVASPRTSAAQAGAVANAIVRHMVMFADSVDIDECTARQLLGVSVADSVAAALRGRVSAAWLTCSPPHDTALVGVRPRTELRMESVELVDGHLWVAFRAFRVHASRRERYRFDAQGEHVLEVRIDQFAQFTPGRPGRSRGAPAKARGP